MNPAYPPDLSIIVPVLNEVETLPALFGMLSRQEQVAFEMVLVDGGSSDGSLALARELAALALFPCCVIGSEKGRARQLNAGAREARAGTLLFLHVDSTFPDPLALRRGLDALAAAIARRGEPRVAGRFALRFDVPLERYGFGYYFYEAKTRLGRPEGIHGDQGFLLPREFFASLRGFDESLPLLEDSRLAETVRRAGEWLLLPAEIVTSARRFETEGLAERQTINALLMNFAAIGRDDLLCAFPEVYCSQDRTERLQVGPFFRTIRSRLRSAALRERWSIWYATGGYVRRNAWQLAFARDVWRSFSRGLPPGTGATSLLELHDRWFDRLTDHAAGRLATAALVWGWFHLKCLRLRIGSANGQD